MVPTCTWCGRPAGLLCDGPAAAGRTCDAPLCRRHALRVAAVHLYFGGGKGRWETTDHCPDCVARTQLAGGDVPPAPPEARPR
jgi:hypothetical protein